MAVRTPYQLVCKRCGREFESFNKNQIHCSMVCANKTQAENSARRRIEKDRPFTPDTVYLINLWNSEGTSAREIAEIMNRPVNVIEDVLAGNVDKYEVMPVFPGGDVPKEGKRRYRQRKIEEDPVQKPRKERSGRAVKCVETGMVYSSRKEAAKLTGINESCLSQCCTGRILTAGGYHWVNA